MQLAFLWLINCAYSDSEDGDIEVTADTKQQSNYGLELEPLKPYQLRDTVTCFGRVVDPGPLFNQWRSMLSAKTELRLAKSEAERARRLEDAGQLASQSDTQTAIARRKLAARKLEGLRDELALEWGDLARWKDASKTVESIRSGESQIVRLSIPVGSSLDALPDSLEVWSIGQRDVSQRARRLWRSPRTTSEGGPVFLALVDVEKTPWSIGTRLAGALPIGTRVKSGYFIPASAVIFFQGAAWVYQKDGDDTFERRTIQQDAPVKAGWFVGKGDLDDGKQLVIVGAQALLAQENLSRSAPPMGDGD